MKKYFKFTAVLTAFCCSLAHAGIIGEDDRRPINFDVPSELERANRTPLVKVCNDYATGILARRTGFSSDYILIPAHSILTESGAFKTFKSEAQNGNQSEIVCTPSLVESSYIAFERALALILKPHIESRATQYINNVLSWPPINFIDARNFRKNEEDVLIFRLKKQVSEDIMPPHNIPRGYSRFVNEDIAPDDYDSSTFSTVAFHADKGMFHQIQEDFKVEDSYEHYEVKSIFFAKTDMKGISSGSPIFLDVAGKYAVLGFTMGGYNTKIEAPPLPEDISRNYWTHIGNGAKLAAKYRLATYEDEARILEAGMLEKAPREMVRLAQQALNDAGYNAGTPDGIWGKKSDASMRAFADTHDIAYDGIMTPLVWETMQWVLNN